MTIIYKIVRKNELFTSCWKSLTTTIVLIVRHFLSILHHSFEHSFKPFLKEYLVTLYRYSYNLHIMGRSKFHKEEPMVTGKYEGCIFTKSERKWILRTLQSILETFLPL